MTIEMIKNTSMQDFIYKNKWEQQLFIEKVKINELKDKDKLPLLKKFIAMKVLMEVRNATKHSSLNLTAGFRDLLANLSPDLHQKVFKPNKSGDIMYEKEALLAAANIKSPNSYRLFHISDMGTYLWNRKFFKITVDENNNIITQKANTEKRLFDDPDTTIESAQTWDTLNDEYSLKMLFNEIEKETRYDNTLGYDLASVAFFCTNGLLNLSASLGCWSLLSVPVALALSVVVHALVLPVAIALVALEVMIVKPLEILIAALSPHEQAKFIKEVTAPEVIEEVTSPGWGL
ncbi:MAG: hypothetical protein H0T84_15060 [Tatlockia sp.]|nr:hypothetical protein [Tatlockia sp.]